MAWNLLSSVARRSVAASRGAIIWRLLGPAQCVPLPRDTHWHVRGPIADLHNFNSRPELDFYFGISFAIRNFPCMRNCSLLNVSIVN
jgi:hypothetical protein